MIAFFFRSVRTNSADGPFNLNPSWRRSAVVDATRARTVVFRRQLRRPVTKPTQATDRRCAGQSARFARRSCRCSSPTPSHRRYHTALCSSRNKLYFGEDSPRGINCTRIGHRDGLGRAPRRVFAEKSPTFRFSCQCWSAILRQLSRSMTTRGEWKVCACRGHRRLIRWAECIVSASGRHLQNSPRTAQRQRSTSIIVVIHVLLSSRCSQGTRHASVPHVERPRRRCRGQVRVAGRWYLLAAHAKEAEDARQLRAPAMKRERVDGLRELGGDDAVPFRFGIRRVINAFFSTSMPDECSFVERDAESRFVNCLGIRSETCSFDRTPLARH